MSRFKGLVFVSALALALGAAGCSDDSSSSPADGGGNKDTGNTQKDTGPPPTIDCKTNACNTFVFNQLIVPATGPDALKYGYDYDGNQVVDNALGNIIAAVATAMSGVNIQESVDLAVNGGQAILLVEMQAADLTTDPAAILQAHVGKQQSCCPGKEDDPAGCKAAATAAGGCFGGSGTFEISDASPKDAIIKGAIAGGEMAFGPARLALQIPLNANSTITVNLKEARIKGKVTADGITEGVLSGVIPKSDIDNSVLPAIHTLLDGILKDPNTQEDTKTAIFSFFDKDGDKAVTLDEIKNSDVIKTFAGGDVDVDNDGEPELSLGIGFEAVKATIGTVTPTPDASTPTPDAGAGDASN